jgi:hypothetical protein
MLGSFLLVPFAGLLFRLAPIAVLAAIVLSGTI